MARPEAVVPVSKKDQYTRWCIYGEPGVGKTPLAASGRKTLLLLNRAAQAASVTATSTADVWVCEDLSALTEAYEYIRHEGVNTYEWVWIDSATLLQDQEMDDHMATVKAAKAHRDEFVPDKPDYLVVQNKMGNLIRKFAAEPIHFGWTAHVAKYEDRNTGEERLMPMLQGGQGAFSQKMCGYMDVIGYMEIVQSKDVDVRVLHLRKTPERYARSRYATLLGKNGRVINPTVPKMMRAIAEDVPTLQNVPPLPRKAATATKTTRSS